MDWHFCQRTIFWSVVFPRVNGKSSTTNLLNSPLRNYEWAAKTAKVVPKCNIFKLHKSKKLKIFKKSAFLFFKKKKGGLESQILIHAAIKPLRLSNLGLANSNPERSILTDWRVSASRIHKLPVYCINSHTRMCTITHPCRLLCGNTCRCGGKLWRISPGKKVDFGKPANSPADHFVISQNGTHHETTASTVSGPDSLDAQSSA